MRLIVLMGARAAGKTSIGMRVAAHAGCPFVDLDDRVTRMLGAPGVSAAWKAVGEPGFRDAERRALALVIDEAAAAGTLVLALGGGTQTVVEARERLQALRAEHLAFVVWLSAPAAVLAARLADEPGDRPSLTGGDVAEEIAEVLEARKDVYAALADVTVDVDDEPEAVTARVIGVVESWTS